MENASKALIIAGAILLAILIISLGIMIYNQASGVVNNNSMSEVDISSFNTRFTQYQGENIRGAQVNSLLEQIRNNNVTYQDDSSRQVTVNVTASNWQTSGTKPSGNIAGNSSFSKALTGETYKVECTMDEDTGLVDTVTISNPT